MYATSELGEVRIIRCRSRLASESGEMDKARLRLRRGVTRGLENRDAVRQPTVGMLVSLIFHPPHECLCFLHATVWQ